MVGQTLTMSEDRRSIELSVDVDGTTEEVWRAVATGPGITSWYVPHTLEERTGGAATASFGPGPEMQIQGRVAVWEPPRRVCFDGGEGVDGLTFEWNVEPGPDGCTVRLVNSGFGDGSEYDDQYDAMTEGWKLFMFNLKLHLAHFRGQNATSALPMTMWPGSPSEAWAKLTSALGIPAAPAEGDRLAVTAADTPALAGTVVQARPSGVALLVDDPAPGTAFMAAEGQGDHVMVSIWSYLYGEQGAAAVARDEPRWREWLNNLGTA